MANILLVDPSDVARKALKGVLARGRHRMMGVGTVLEAWDFIVQNVKVDLVVLELKLEGDNGLTLLQRLRADPLLKLLPVTIYTTHGDREMVQRAMALGVQNFQIKPYDSDHVLAEVNKAMVNPWRARHFEEERSFCKLMGYTPDHLHQRLAALRTRLTAVAERLRMYRETNDLRAVREVLAELSAEAEACGAWGVVELADALEKLALGGAWVELQQAIESLPLADRVIWSHLNSGVLPEAFLTDQERLAEEDARSRALWFNAPAEQRCPVVARPQLERQIEGLAGFPVIDSLAASFQMAATGQPSSLAPILDLARKDPGLGTALLVAANQLRRKDALDQEPIDDPEMCVGRLGERRLAALATSLLTTEERYLHAPPCSWPQFWMFQTGVAKMARYTCAYLEMPSLEQRAETAGLLHDVGKLLLLHLYPLGFQAIVDHAQQTRQSISLSEQFFLDCTTRDLGAHFAVTHGLPRPLASVMRWAGRAAEAKEDAELVAIVSLARDLCLHNRVGWCGEPPREQARSIAETPEWEILGQRVFPSFDLAKFEAQAHRTCRELKLDLYGRTKQGSI